MREFPREVIEREVRERPYLFTRHPQGWWEVNATGTVMTPVWRYASPLETAVCEELLR